jgi:hypothetical protein
MFERSPAMNLDAVREHANRHAQAMVEGDLKRAAGDLAESGRSDAPSVMAAIPKSIDSATVAEVAAEGDEAVATIVYTGEGRDVSVESRWSEHGDRPMIVGLKLV